MVSLGYAAHPGHRAPWVWWAMPVDPASMDSPDRKAGQDLPEGPEFPAHRVSTDPRASGAILGMGPVPWDSTSLGKIKSHVA